MKGYTVRRYDQLGTFTETIGQELRPAVCERRLTDLRKIIVYINYGYKTEDHNCELMLECPFGRRAYLYVVDFLQ